MASANIPVISGPPQEPLREIHPFPPAEGPKCPWAHVAASPPRPSNLNEIMSEQLAEGLQVEEEQKYLKEILSSDEDEKESVLPLELDLSGIMSQDNTDCTSDELIANMLQMQYNKEYDLNLKKVEQKYNGSSKSKILPHVIILHMNYTLIKLSV